MKIKKTTYLQKIKIGRRTPGVRLAPPTVGRHQNLQKINNHKKNRIK